MSLFDVIKHGNIDLGNPDHLRGVPRQVFWTYYYKLSNDGEIYSSELEYHLKCIGAAYRFAESYKLPEFQLKLRRLFKEALMEYK